ncbi:MAG: universal stress protein [Nitrospirae bacterium]|nr:universal stress protein [Nitrospirota bacterium]
MLRRILIPYDPSPYAAAALEYGCFLAKKRNAEVTGVVVLDTPGIKKSIGPTPLGGIYYAEKLEKTKEEKAREHIKALLGNFREKCQREGVAHRESELQGSPSEQIIQDSIFYDLMVMGISTHFDFETAQTPGDSVERILSNVVTPVLTVPDSISLKEKMNVLIAFDGSLPAVRAMKGFVHLFDTAVFETDITLLMSGIDEDIAKFYLDGATAYLNAHSFSSVKVEQISQDIIEAMEERYLQWADMVVLGVHSKKGLLDFMIGSLSRHLIRSGNKPLLFGQ